MYKVFLPREAAQAADSKAFLLGTCNTGTSAWLTVYGDQNYRPCQEAKEVRIHHKCFAQSK